jgi:hypothetical protein
MEPAMTVPSVREALERCTGALQMLPGSERDIIKFTGKWADYGSMTVAEILDQANAALATPPAPTPSAASLPREGKTIEEQIASAQGHDLLSLLRDYLSINLKPSGDLARLYIARITAILAAPPSAAREKIARVIDPSAFKNWQGQYDYGLKANSNEPEARRCADYFHKAACDEALAKADAILALLPDAAAIRAAAFEEAAGIAEQLAAQRCAKERSYGYGPKTATPVANLFWCEEIAAAIRAAGENAK